MAPYLKVSSISQYEFLNNKNQKSTSALKDVIKNRKIFTDQKFTENGELSKGIFVGKPEMSQLNDLRSNELQDSLKQQTSFARNWVKKNVVPSRDTTLSFCVLLIAYYQFCKENDQLPLKAEKLLQVLQSSFESDDSLCFDGQSSKTDRNNQEYLSSLVELKLEDAACGDDAPKDDLIELKNLRFKCDFIKTESYDEAYESDLSDSDMKEVGTGIPVPDCINSEDKDSSYESYDDEISNEATSFRVKSEDKDFKKQCEVTSICEISLANRPNGPTQATTVSDIKKEINQTPENKKRQLENDDRHNILLSPPKMLKWTEDQKKVIVNMKGLLDFHLQNYKGSECYIQAKNLSDTVVGMLQRKQLRYFLEEFGHAMSCGEKHGSLCFMFKRVVNHVLKATHECALKNMYGHILRLHLDACKEDDCGFPNCKIRREERRERLMNQWEQKNLSQSESN